MKKMLVCAVILLTAVSGSAAFAQHGQEVYKTNCAPCHGEKGASDTPAGQKFKAPALNSPDVFKKSDAELIAFTKKGKGQMPPWADVLSDSEVKSVIAYIHTLEKK